MLTTFTEYVLCYGPWVCFGFTLGVILMAAINTEKQDG